MCIRDRSSIAQTVQASTTMAIDAMFKQMKADGIDVIGFGAGEPDFNTPEHIKQAAIDAIHDNFTKYTPCLLYTSCLPQVTAARHLWRRAERTYSPPMS